MPRHSNLAHIGRVGTFVGVRYFLLLRKYPFYDTLCPARRIFGDSVPDHRLPTIAKECGYDLTRHHHALADAEACAYIAMKLL